jgi:hypothetical protein
MIMSTLGDALVCVCLYLNTLRQTAEGVRGLVGCHVIMNINNGIKNSKC